MLNTYKKNDIETRSVLYYVSGRKHQLLFNYIVDFLQKCTVFILDLVLTFFVTKEPKFLKIKVLLEQLRMMTVAVLLVAM